MHLPTHRSVLLLLLGVPTVASTILVFLAGVHDMLCY